MEQTFNLEQYLANGVEHFVQSAVKATLKNPRESAFLLQYGAAVKRAEKRRHAMELKGEHIPSFLIASITTNCNLRCTGCYAQANQGCNTGNQMPAAQWGRIFTEAAQLGVAMVLLAGGEPLVRKDVIEEAARQPNIAFPIFTNGTMITDEYVQMFNTHRNLVPIVSIEGDEAITDARRGPGIYAATMAAMARLQKLDLLFGASVTVTSENLHEVTSEAFVEDLLQKGCKVLLYISYVPVDERDIALTKAQEDELDTRVHALRNSGNNMIIVSFPGDEKEAEGCLAAGRGFFHINATGGAEPCPFSPYSDTNLQNTSLQNALKSPLFTKLRTTGILQQEHTGGCVLFYQSDAVKQLVETYS